ncbi:hypothetical protein FB451DRAFT_1407542 [Mycena latifolia]|nr:hypothetical protein FB451DRAFT_1407542 [Mycena latifolia]
MPVLARAPRFRAIGVVSVRERCPPCALLSFCTRARAAVPLLGRYTTSRRCTRHVPSLLCGERAVPVSAHIAGHRHAPDRLTPHVATLITHAHELYMLCPLLALSRAPRFSVPGSSAL